MSITLGSRVKAPTYSLPPHLAQVYRKEIQLPTLTWKQAGLLMNSTRNYHVKANLTLICYNEIHFVPTYLYLLRNRNTPGKVLAWRKHCSHAGSRTLLAQLQCLLPAAGAACSAQQEEDLQQRGAEAGPSLHQAIRILFRNARRGPPRARSRGGATGWNSAR